ncbi:unnamed protein product [Rhizophagus irregularis]|nr:unnamed protein product [Rhizophagus irregularis]
MARKILAEVSTTTPTQVPIKSHCTYIDLPNHPMANQRNECMTKLTKTVHTINGELYRPSLIFPIVSLKHQLQLMYNRKGFESSCRKWADRCNVPQYLNDIYDGRVWKTFWDEDQNLPFFRKEVADRHLALIPGPNEPSLHYINHYLAPIVDQLLELWNGIELSGTYESTNKPIRAAVICCSCDIPAARKLCGYISARVACHRCLKKVQFNDRNQPNFGGFDNIDEWFVERDINQVQKNAQEWLECKTKDAKSLHVRDTSVRWSEMYRLSYFDSVRFLIIDPMHCLFLGIAKWIVLWLWIEEGRLTQKDLKIMQNRAKLIKVPADIGRIPYRIDTGEGFSGFTADQWKNFILVYATTITWDLLRESDRAILANFVRACNILVCRTISINGLEEAHKRLLTMVKLIEQNYGPEKISPNLHLCLHIYHCALDYGPLYAFYERMNGLLASKETSGSLAVQDEFDEIDYQKFLFMSRNVEKMAGTSSESFPGTFLNPKRINTDLPKEILDLLVEYYYNTYENKDFVALANIHVASPEAIPVLLKVNIYGRLRLGSEVFASSYSKRHITSAKILSQFTHGNTKDTYPGIVQFYFEHTLHLPEGSKKHALAFVRWYRPANNHNTRFHCKINDEIESCNIELWKKEFFEYSRDCIILVHSILGRFIEGSFTQNYVLWRKVWYFESG